LVLMIEPAAPMTRSPSVLMTAVSLIVSGWVVSLFVGLWLPLGYGGSGVVSSIAYTTLVTSLLGGLVLRAVLPRLTGVEIAYGWAVVALGAGNLVANVFTVTVERLTARHMATAGIVLGSSPLLALTATGIGFLVSYAVIVLYGQGPHNDGPPTRLPGMTMSRSSASLFLPAIVVAALATAFFVKPWQHFGGGSGAAFPSVVGGAVLPTPAAPTTASTSTKQPGTGHVLGANQLEALLQDGLLPQTHQWNCTTDPAKSWNYICTETQLREVWGYNVDASKITGSDELSYAGHKLVP
jgi:hypothetical protein